MLSGTLAKLQILVGMFFEFNESQASRLPLLSVIMLS